MNYPKVYLKAKRSASVLRKHPWIFSGAIAKIELGADQELIEGDNVAVYDHKDRCLGVGHFADGSIAVRLLSFNAEELGQQFWEEKLQVAFQLRKALGLTDSESTNAYRLVHAEGDGLAGLIIDIYNEVAVIQAHSLGMLKNINLISNALQTVFGDKLKAIYNKSAQTVHADNVEIEDGYAFGKTECPTLVQEYAHQFKINWEDGQKTGFFLDQRENRKLLAHYAKDKKVLNTFCYSGGFSVYALQAGAKLVHSVDSSQKAIDLTDENVALIKNLKSQHQSFAQDTFSFLKASKESYDLIVLDPPAYAKNQRAKHKAVQGYRRLNEKAFRLIESGGILFTFSCSQVVDRQLFENTIRAAAIDAGREVKVLHHLSQPADHPVNIFHPEGEYLKGLVLYVK